ncbi:MAG: hypothetical protein ACREX3_01530 [Gammaproteobacteria bacterium]
MQTVGNAVSLNAESTLERITEPAVTLSLNAVRTMVGVKIADDLLRFRTCCSDPITSW